MSKYIPPKGFTELVEDGDPELLCEDSEEQEIREDKKFCPLCAKYKIFEEAKFVDVQAGPVRLVICKSCNIVLHNLNVILQRARERIAKKAMEVIEESKSGKSPIILPFGKGLIS
jgi:hypothetical protein